MLKNILNLKGAQKLSNDEQKEISGGAPRICKVNGVCTIYASHCVEPECRTAIIVCPPCPDGTPTPYQGTPQQCAMWCNV